MQENDYSPKTSKPLETVDAVDVGDLVRVMYADHILFVNKDPKLFHRPPVLDTTGKVVHQDSEVIVLAWENFSIPSEDGPKPRASGVTIHRGTILSLQRVS